MLLFIWYLFSLSKVLALKQPWLDSSWEMEVTVQTEHGNMTLAKSRISATMNTSWEISDRQVSKNLLWFVWWGFEDCISGVTFLKRWLWHVFCSAMGKWKITSARWNELNWGSCHLFCLPLPLTFKGSSRIGLFKWCKMIIGLVSFRYWTFLKHHCSVQECISEQSKEVQLPCNKIDPAKGDCSSCCGFTEENLPEPRIVLLGPTGVGKSTFGNRYFGDSLTLIVQQKRFCSSFQALDTQGIAILKKAPFQKYPDFVGIKIAFEPHPHPPLSNRYKGAQAITPPWTF